MKTNKLLTILAIVGLLSLTSQPLFAAATETPDASSPGASLLLDENFDATPDGEIPSGWTKTGDWGVAYGGEAAKKVLYADYFNVPYAGDKSSTITAPAINLANATGATISLIATCDTEYTPNTDYVTLMASKDGTNWTSLLSWNEPTLDSDTDQSYGATKSLTANIPSDLFGPSTKIAFSWKTNATDNDHDGCSIDALKVSATGASSGGQTGGTGSTTGTATSTTATSTPGTTDTPGNGGTGGTGSTTATSTTATSTETTGNSNSSGTTTPVTGGGTGSTTATSTGSTGTTGNTGGTGTSGGSTAGNSGGPTNDTSSNRTIREVSSCQALTDSTVEYRLVSDINAASTCFTVATNGVWFNGNNHVLTGNNAANVNGIEVTNASNVTVKNVRVQNFDFGVHFKNVSGGRIENVTAGQNSYGIVLHSSNTSTVTGNYASVNQNSGIYVEGNGLTITGNTANNNSVGIDLVSTTQSTVKDNSTASNDRGILLLQSSTNTLDGNTANSNTFGFALENGSSHNALTRNVANDNRAGVSLGASENTIDGLQLGGSIEKAIRFYDTNSYNNVIKNVAIHTSQGLDLSFDPASGNAPAANADGSVFYNSPIGKYSIAGPGGTIRFENQYGSVSVHVTSGSGDNLSNDVRIENGKVTINPTSIFAGNALISMPTTAMNPTVKQNGSLCSSCTTASTQTSGSYTFNATGGGTFEFVAGSGTSSGTGSGGTSTSTTATSTVEATGGSGTSATSTTATSTGQTSGDLTSNNGTGTENSTSTSTSATSTNSVGLPDTGGTASSTATSTSTANGSGAGSGTNAASTTATSTGSGTLTGNNGTGTENASSTATSTDATSAGNATSTTATTTTTTTTSTQESGGGGGGGGGGSSSAMPSSHSGAYMMGDLNGDRIVNLVDVALLFKNWNEIASLANKNDVNNDGRVDLTDFNIIMVNWTH